jgi:hypothetical protein
MIVIARLIFAMKSMSPILRATMDLCKLKAMIYTITTPI